MTAVADEPDLPNEESARATARRNVAILLSDEAWHTTMEINHVAVGGSEGCRRLRELRDDCRAGRCSPYWNILAERIGDGTTQWRYRLSREPVDDPEPPTLADQMLATLRSYGMQDVVDPPEHAPPLVIFMITVAALAVSRTEVRDLKA